MLRIGLKLELDQDFGRAGAGRRLTTAGVAGVSKRFADPGALDKL
jgi:hypothetical protein